MNAVEIQFVTNEAGEPTAVIVPIDLWREIESERETAYLLKSEPMRRRLLAAKQREDGIPFEAVLENFAFDGASSVPRLAAGPFAGSQNASG